MDLSPQELTANGRTRGRLVLQDSRSEAFLPEPSPLERSFGSSAPVREDVAGRVAALELSLREREEALELRDTELSAMERDLVVKDRYAAYLEQERHLVDVELEVARKELGQVRERAAELFSDLERCEARATELGALVAEIRAQPTYRIAHALSSALHRTGPLGRALQRAVRRTAGR